MDKCENKGGCVGADYYDGSKICNLKSSGTDPSIILRGADYSLAFTTLEMLKKSHQ